MAQHELIRQKLIFYNGSWYKQYLPFMWSSSSIPYVIEPYYTIESSSSFSRWGEGESGLAKEPLRILASFFFLRDYRPRLNGQKRICPTPSHLDLYALLRPDPCLVSHHTRSGALKHGHQEWLPRHIKSSCKIVLVCGKSLENFGPGLWTCSSLR